GKFHSVRLGKYNNKYEVEKYLSSKKKRFSSHLVMKAYYIDERIEKIYVPTKTKADAPQAEAEPANKQSPVTIQTQVAGKVVDNVDKKSDAKPLNSYAPESIYTIQTGSFQSITAARKQYDSYIQLFKDNEIDHFRIEKIGQYHSVRLGKFDKRDEAEKYLTSIKERLKSYLVMKAYYKEERIEELYVSSKTGMDSPKIVASSITKPLPVSVQPRVAEKDLDKVDRKSDANPGEKEIEATSALVEKKRDKDALEAIKTKLAVRPEDPEINGRYGTMLFRLKQPGEAIPYLRKAAELSPEVPEYHISIGYCYILLSKFNEAVDEFNRAVTISPSHVGALAGLGISYSELGEKDKAMRVYDKLKNLDSVLTKILLQIIEET
ncbi:MAG: SPOR domain-containing protein, partial [Candidatus Heimdallarchaeota archaeon]|nr:SPOR domain-containing protein [Candidatus Heimdallarchaeota archaeon]